jgi:RNA polymerase sigma-70 factor (ECF subfamily)
LWQVLDMNEAEMVVLLQQAAAGDARAASVLLAPHRERLRRMVELRLHRRLRGRIDAEDIIQETFLEAVRRLPDYLARPDMSFPVWLRFLAGQQLVDAMRHHLGMQKRDARLEVSLYRGPMPEASSASLASLLLGRMTTPSQAAVRIETQLQVQELLNNMDPVDREVLVLRHFEHLNNNEVAELLGLSKSAASKRYVVALKRLGQIMSEQPGLREDCN